MTDSQQPTRGLMRRVVIRGGPGSGHFGHEGRPGKVGGSAPGDFHSGQVNKRIKVDSVELSRAHRNFLLREMGGSTSGDYPALWEQLRAGNVISGAEVLDDLYTHVEGVIDRVDFGDKDAQAYRDRAKGREILALFTPGDFHSAEPEAYGKGVDSAAMEVFLAGLKVTADDAMWLEKWFSGQGAEADPLEKEVVVGPSGKAFDVESFGGHQGAGDNSLTALGRYLSKERGVEVTFKPVDGYTWDIETYDESVGPEGDGWDRNEKGELTFQYLSHRPGERGLFPLKYVFQKDEDGKLHAMISTHWDSARASYLANSMTNALEIAGRDQSVAWDTEEQAKQYTDAELFGKVSTFSIDVYGLSGEGRNYQFRRVPPKMLESLGLDPAKNIVPEYNWTDSRTPPFLTSTVEETVDELRKYVEGRAQPPDANGYVPNYAMGGIDGERALLAMGFMRISRGIATSPQVGISWNQTAGLTGAQRRVAVRVAKASIEREGVVAWERMMGYNPERQNWGDTASGIISELPDNKFTAALQGSDVPDLRGRSYVVLPEWAERLLIQRGGPGSGHFGHAGRPGEVGGSAPGDFHSAEGESTERINTSYVKDRFGFLPTAADVAGIEARFPVTGFPASEVGEEDLQRTEFWMGPDASIYPMNDDLRHADAATKAISDWYGPQVERIAPLLSLRQRGDAPAWTDLYYRQTIDFNGEERSAYHMIASGKPVGGTDAVFWEEAKGSSPLASLSKEESQDPSKVFALGKNFLFETLLRVTDYDPEYLLAAHGFVRVSRGGTGGSKAVGLTWDATLPPTESQRRVIMDVVNQSAEDGGAIVYEAVNATNSIPGTEGVITAEEWPSQRRAFVAGLQGDYKQANIVRSLPDWVLTLMIRGGPGSGHFGHAGRPGEVGGSAPGDFHSAVSRPTEEINRFWLAENTDIPAELWDEREDPRRISDWLELYYADANGPDDEFYLSPEGDAYNVNEPTLSGTGKVTAIGHGDVGYWAIQALIDQKREEGELVAPDIEEAKESVNIIPMTTESDMRFTKFRQEGPEEEYGGTITNGKMTYQVIIRPENAERSAWQVDFLDTALGKTETIFSTEDDLPQHIAGRLFRFKAAYDVQDKDSEDSIATIFEDWPSVADIPGKPFSVVADTAHFLPAHFATFEDAKTFAIDKSARFLAEEKYKVRYSMDHEGAMSALGFIRVSRGGSGGSQVGMTIDQYLGPTSAQARYLTKIAREAIENDGSVAWQAGRASGAIEEWPSNEFTAAMQGQFTVRSVYDLPAWARRMFVRRGGAGSGHFKHEGRTGARGGSEPGDRLPKDRGEQMKQAKQDFQSAEPSVSKRERVGAPAAHIGPGYRMNMTADAFSKYRPAVSAALEWAVREFKQMFGGQVEGVTVHDDPVAFVEANDPEMYAESMAKLDEEGKRDVEAGLRQDFGKSLASYNPETKQMLVNVGKHIKPDGALDTDSVMGAATHEFVHWATFGSGRDEIWKEVKVPQGFKDIFWGPYSKDLIQQEYVARVVSSEMRGSDTLTLPGDIVTLAMTDEDHKNARLLMDKISNAFVAPNLEMPTTLRVSPERLVDVTVPDGLGNFWGRAVPESQLDSLPAGSTVNAIYAMLKGEEAFEEGRTIRPDVLSLNWLDETDPARHPVRQQITKKPRLDDVTVAVRSQDNVLERVLDTIGGALRELMGMKHG